MLSSCKYWMIMSVKILRLKNLISALSLLILESRTGNMNDRIGSLIDKSTLVFELMLSVISNKGFKNSSAPGNE